jgi:phenylalanyl-tRNA synthetase beta chain
LRILPTWLREFVNVAFDDRRLAEDLTSAGIAVESIAEENGETIYEMDLTTNRVDAMNHYGVAREASAVYGVELKPVTPKLPGEDRGPSTRSPNGGATSLRMTHPKDFPIVIDDPEGCARYTARVIRNVEIGPSPEHIQRRLELLGSRAINNAADATNYAINELGHPTHAFDLDLLAGGTIIVRRAEDGEFLKTLDGVGRTLTADDLVIADAEKPVALAGVMGGFDSMITEKTKNVLIESAWFDPASVRRTAKHHGMHTDASHRFERGADWGITPLGCDRVAELILESAGGELIGQRIDAVARSLEQPPIALHRSEVKRILGIDLDEREIERILGKLGFIVARANGDFNVTIPTWRLDVEREIDLLEELARIYGYNRFPNTLPSFAGAVVALPDDQKNAKVRDTMLALGYDETIAITFISEPDARAFSTVEPLALANPLSEEAGFMRTSLLPGLLNMVAYNLNRGNNDVRLFEAGEVFAKNGDRHEEHRTLAFAASGKVVSTGVTGKDEPFAFVPPKRNIPEWMQSLDDFLRMKGDVEELLAAFQHHGLYFDAMTPPYFHPRRSALAVLDGETVARFGQLHPAVAAARKLRQDVYIAEVLLDRLYRHELREPKYESISKFPAVARDFSFVFDNAVPFERIRSAVEALGIAEMLTFTPREIYRGDKTHPSASSGQAPGKTSPGGAPAAPGKYSILLHAEFQSKERTLRDDEVAQWAAQIVQTLEKLGGVLRG